MTRLLMIGLGGVARVHLQAAAGLDPAVRLVGVDPDPQRRQWAAQGFGVEVHADLASALRGAPPTLACVLTPAQLHCEHGLQVITAGVPVLCEKPLAVSVADASVMQAAAAAFAVPLFYGACWRWLPATLAARSLIQAGAIGRPRLLVEQVLGGRGAASRRALPAAHYPPGGPGGGGMGLIDHGVHLIDLFAWWLGEPVQSVFGQGEVSGQAMLVEHVQLRFASGALGLLTYFDGSFPTRLPAEGSFGAGSEWNPAGVLTEAGRFNPEPGEICVYGESGALRVRHYANELYLFDTQGGRRIALDGAPAPAHFARQLQAVLHDLSTGATSAARADAGLAALRVIDAVHRSRAQQREIPLD